MKIRENVVKSRLKAGKVVTVIEGYHSAEIVDFLGPLGFDGVWVENEHGHLSLYEIQNITRSCDLWGMTSLIRVNKADYGLIYRTLDQGAQGVIVPHVNTAVEATEVVRASRYAPEGERGMYQSRQANGIDPVDYFEAANDETLVVVMIEDIIAVENLPELLEVEGVDVFFVAHGDLSASMGLTGQVEHPDVKNMVKCAITQITDAGRTAGGLSTTENVRYMVDLGASFLMTGWPSWVTEGGSRYLRAVEEAT